MIIFDDINGFECVSFLRYDELTSIFSELNKLLKIFSYKYMIFFFALRSEEQYHICQLSEIMFASKAHIIFVLEIFAWNLIRRKYDKVLTGIY